MDTPFAPNARELLKNRNVTGLLLANFVNIVSLTLQTTALLAHVYSITGRKLDLGFVGLAEFAPAALLMLITGSVADRFNRKRVLMIAILAEAICLGSLAIYSSTDPTAVGPMFGIIFLFGVARAFAAPCWRSLPPMVAPDGALPRVVALNSICFQSAVITGPALGGFLFDVNPTLPYIVASGLLAFSFCLYGLVHVRPTQKTAESYEKPSFRSAIEGLKFIRRTPILFAAISLDLFAVLFGGAVALIPAIATDNLGVDATGQGWLRAAGGIGAASMAILLAAKPLRRNVGKTLYVVVAIFGLATIVLGVTRNYWMAIGAMIILSGADMVSVFIRGTLVPLATPDDKRGRVTAVEMVFIGASNELGGFESGVAAEILGTSGAIIFGGLATLAVVAVFCVAFPALRKVDRFSDVEVPHEQPKSTP